jgi:NADH-ubiquinone oxidoreductase chain 5
MDLKKIVALSTLRQLGVIVRTLAFGLVELAFAHLILHAIFKALLFIRRGKIIHRSRDRQDIRFIGGLLFNLPYRRIVLNLANYSLCGIPFLSGFYSKDLIVELILMEDFHYFKYIIYIILVGFSISYSFRLTYFSIRFKSRQFIYRNRDDKD